MKLYSGNGSYKLYQGNMLDMLEVIEPNSIDSIITDPPYELNFMGKGWDNSGIAFQPSTWQKCYEALKPGGYLLAFGGSRTFHRIAVAIEDAGFEIRDTIMWLYGSGFPKSMDISKQIDKKGGDNYSIQFSKDLKQARENRNLTMKYCDDKYCNGSTNWSWYEGREAGVRVPDYNTYLEIVKDFPELEKYRELIKEAEREVIGTKKSGGASAWINGMNNKENEEQKYTGFSEWDITTPSTDLAKKWQGWGTALKPSFEPIIVARKPFKGSLVDNVIKNGVGGINIDECRVEYANDSDKEFHKKEIDRVLRVNTPFNNSWKNCSNLNNANPQNEQGRFPANTILTYDEADYDEVCGGFPNTKGSKPHARGGTNFGIGIESDNRKNDMLSGFNDSGSASRYFYNAKTSKKDRDEGLEEFEEKKTGELQGGRKEGSAGSIMKNADGGTRVNPYAGAGIPKKNIHPTVKPTNLMQYLVRLVTPNGGTILDPFNGSGSTGKAVMYENKERNKGYKYIGIELTEEYLPISKARIEYVCNLKNEELKEKQLSLFD